MITYSRSVETHAPLDAGERNPSNLVRQTTAGLAKLAPAGYEKDAEAKALMDKLQHMADRVAGVRRAAQAFTLAMTRRAALRASSLPPVPAPAVSR